MKNHSQRLIVALIMMTAWCMLRSVQAQTPYYHLNRSFSSVQFDLQGIPTEYQLNEESDKLTDIVQGEIQLNSNETYAIEKQAAIPICYVSPYDAWDAAVNYTGSTSIYSGKIFDNVGWVRGVENTSGGWGAYLWVLQNRIEFQASTSYWWQTTNGIPVAITNVMVGSLGDYQPMTTNIDIGPHLDAATNNNPGINLKGEEKSYQVDITNVYYELVIPDIWITPREAVTCVGGSNVQYTVTGTNIPNGVNWSMIPDLSGSGGATIPSNGAWQAEVTPGNMGTNYIVRATSKDNTNFYDQVDLGVRKVDIVETNIYLAVSDTVTLHLTADSSANTEWEIIPELQSGAYIEGSDSGTSIVINAGSIPTNYTVKAYAEDLTNCYDTCTVTVFKVDLDVDSNNDGVIDSNDAGEDEYEQYEPGVIICKDRYGDTTNLDHLVEMKLALLPCNLTNGTLTLEASTNGNFIKIWTNSAKSTEVILPKTYILGTDTIPSSLWIDGVSTGQVFLDLYYKDSGGIEICRDKVAVYVTKTVSRGPSGTFAYGWEPCGWESEWGITNGGQGAVTPQSLLTNVYLQGWDIVTCRWRDTSYSNDVVEGCTLTNFQGMRWGGLLEISTHANADGIAACYFLSEASATNWIAGENDMTAYYALECFGMYGVFVVKAWFENNWQSQLNSDSAITMFMACHGATGGDVSLVAQAGGRVKFGYDSEPSHTNDAAGWGMRANNTNLFGRMNGSLNNATNRCAGEAYGDGSEYGQNLRMFGNGWTTLCPAPVAVFPSSSPGNRKGWGCIIFDTYMDDNYAAAEAVTKISGACSVSNFRWVDNGSGKFCLGFDFDNTGGGGATMRAHADKCRNSCCGGLGQKLDGNRVQESGDDKDWNF